MMAPRPPAAPSSPLTPSLEALVEQLGIDMASEPELLHVVSEMQSTPLPPTWTVAKSAVDQENDPRSTPPQSDGTAAPKLEYTNRVTGEVTSRHPGTAHFLAIVAHARKPKTGVLLENEDSAGLLQSPRQAQRSARISNTKEDERVLFADIRSDNVAHGDKLGDETATTFDDAVGGTARGRDASTRGKGCKQRKPVPKWLIFTSWWNETTRGTENITTRKHASIRYNTGTSAFEIELENIPSIFEVSHATGRYGKVGTIDMRVGAQISILGRQMRLMQCDGQTAEWLESEVRAITKAKTALISALEKGGDDVRVRCRSDRVQVSASMQRGGDSVGYAASMDRRSVLRDVVILRDILAKTQPEEARRLSQGVL